MTDVLGIYSCWLCDSWVMIGVFGVWVGVKDFGFVVVNG